MLNVIFCKVEIVCFEKWSFSCKIDLYYSEKNCLKFLTRPTTYRTAHTGQGKQEIKVRMKKEKSASDFVWCADYNLMSCYASWHDGIGKERRKRFSLSVLCLMMANELYLVAEEVAETKVQENKISLNSFNSRLLYFWDGNAKKGLIN